MNRLAALTLAAGLACALPVGAANPTGAAEPTPQARLRDAMAVDVDGRSDKVCPMTIALTPRENGTFLLGCGWCNGG